MIIFNIAQLILVFGTVLWINLLLKYVKSRTELQLLKRQEIMEDEHKKSTRLS